MKAPTRAVHAALAAVVLAAVAGLSLAACGLAVKSPDLFLLTRTGQGQRLTLLISDDGAIHCDGGPVRQLTDPQLLAARDVATSLDDDVKQGLKLPAAPSNSVFSYAVKLQDGTLRFPDTAARSHPEIARAEQFVLQAAQSPCGLTG